MDRIIFHCDCNSFYASVELLAHPDLRHYPVAVCGDPESRHGIILAKNEHAKAFGVKTAETIWQARKKCPDLILLPAHHRQYKEISRRVNTIYEEYTDLVEPFGIDESWLDVTGSIHLFGGDPAALADTIRERIRTEIGITISIGISFNKVFAKLGSDYKKPDATTVISRENFRSIIWPLPVTDLLYVGQSAKKVFERFQITTIGELAAFDRNALFTVLGKNGAQLHDFANGIDHTPVAPAGIHETPKSVGNGLTFPKNLTTQDEVKAGITMLSDQVAVRLRRYGLKCCCVSLSIRDPEFRDMSRQCQLHTPTSISREIAQNAWGLAQEYWDMSCPVRALTVTAQSLVPAEESAAQIDLLGGPYPNREKLERLENAMDAIRTKYGKSAISHASVPIEQGKERHAPPPGGSPDVE